MRVAIFCHSLLSDWNHGNAHFLRGIVTELRSRGHPVRVFEPADAWSMQNLLAEQGTAPLRRLRSIYPHLVSTQYEPGRLDLDRALGDIDLAIVHEWNDPDLVRRIGEHRARARNYRLLFHDTHHRSVTDSKSMAAYDLRHYDGVLAFGAVIRDLYLERGWAQRAWVWHEAADIRVFRPFGNAPIEGDLVWVGNWGDEERTAEIHAYLIDPVRDLKLKARIHGVRYPQTALQTLSDAGIEYAGWLPNYDVPRVFSRFRTTVHIPRCPYARALPGIPTIRVFEALACGIPLITAPWDDAEGLFTPGSDYLVARDGAEMRRHLRAVLRDPALARALAEHGRRTIVERHTCAHRVDQLIEIYTALKIGHGHPVTRPRQDAALQRAS